MTIEISGAGFTNKGGELMLQSVVHMLEAQFPVAKITMEPTKEYKKRAKLGLYQKLSKYYLGFDFSLFGKLVPSSVCTFFGLVKANEVDVLLDASGFALGDQWGKDIAKLVLHRVKKAKKNGALVILLPQAFGPFTQSEVARAMQEIALYCDLIYARDQISYDNLKKLTIPSEILRQAPDFTVLESVDITTIQRDTYGKKVCIIPNKKMMIKTKEKVAINYLNFLKKCIQTIQDMGSNVFILTHETKTDEKLAEELLNGFDESIPIICESDPLQIKAIIGASKGVISSRYHGIVSGLSQSVPTLGTSWNHKYETLFEEYGCSDSLFKSLDMSEESVKKKCELLVIEEKNILVRKQLVTYAIMHKQKSKNMWEEIFNLINTNIV